MMVVAGIWIGASVAVVLTVRTELTPGLILFIIPKKAFLSQCSDKVATNCYFSLIVSEIIKA